MYIFTIENGAVVEHSNPQDLYDQYAATAPLPTGIGRVDFYEPVEVFSVDGSEFERLEEAEEYAENNHLNFAIEVVTKFALCTWAGSAPRTWRTVDSEQEAHEQLDRCARIDFDRDVNAPAIYHSAGEANAAILELMED